jgi:hypothetical protein
MSELTAIDILIDPDEAAMVRAREVNTRLLESVPLPEGWVRDDTHRPHITTLQRYVRTADLDKVYEAVEKAIAATDLSALAYTATGITHADWGFPGIAPTVLSVETNAAVLDFQAELLGRFPRSSSRVAPPPLSSPTRAKRSARRSSTGSRSSCPIRSAPVSTTPTSRSGWPLSTTSR